MVVGGRRVVVCGCVTSPPPPPPPRPDGTTFIFYSPADGTVSGSPRCGTYRLYLRMRQNAGLAATQYDVDSEGAAALGASIQTFNRGGLRGKMSVTSIAHTGYPAGTNFAYGVASDENMTMRVTHTQRFEDTGTNQTVRCITIRNADSTTIETGSTIEAGSATTTDQTFVCDTAYDTNLVTYGVKFEVVGTAALVFSTAPTADKWTVPISGDASILVVDTNTVKDQNVFDADPRLTIGSVTAGQAVYNRGELATHSFEITNSRSEALTRSMSWDIKDSGGSTKATKSDTGATYGDATTGDYTILSTDDAAFDTTGAQWTVAITTSAAHAAVANIYKVSRKILIGTTAGGNDKIVTNDSTSPRNRSETHQFHVTVGFARGAAYASKSSITVTVRKSDGTTPEQTLSSQTTDGSGVLSVTGATYTVAATDEAAFTLAGSNKFIDLSHGGNTSDTSTAAWAVSRMWQFSTSGVSVNNRIFSGKASNPTTQNITRNRVQDVFWDSYIYNVRSELLASPTINFGVERIGGAAFDYSAGSLALSSGRFNGVNAKYTTAATDVAEGKTLVIGSASISTSNQPRTGTAGSGNFAESDTSTAEFTVSSTYVVESRVQKEATRNTDSEDTQLTIGFDSIYNFGNVLDQSGDPVDGVTVNFDQRDPSDVSRQTGSAVTNSGGDTGWTPSVGFDTRTPGGTGWVHRATITTFNGNTGTDDQAVAMVSAFTANKNVAVNVFPLDASGNAIIGRSVQASEVGGVGVVLQFLVSGVVSAPDSSPAPTCAVSRVKDLTATVSEFEYLQSDGSYSTSPTYFTMTVGSNTLNYFIRFRPSNSPSAAGTVIIPTTSWVAGEMNLLSAIYYQTQEFRDDEEFDIVASTPQNPYGTAALPEASVVFSAGGHAHTGSTDGNEMGDRS